MAAESDGGSGLTDVRASLAAFLDAYRYMEMPLRRYLLTVLGPVFVFGVASAAVVVVLPLSLAVAAPLAVAAAFVPALALAYPKVRQDRRRKQIRERFYLFLTHVTVLSLTNIDRVEIFRTLATEDEYRALAEEMGHLVALIDAWNLSLGDACRHRAQRVSSPLLSDFLERLAYTVGAGQDIGDFLVDEQDVILQQFTNRYRNDLRKIEVMKELYMSMVLSTTFLLVFAVVLPVLVGVDPVHAVGGVLVLFTLVQTGFVAFIHTMSPYDLVWYFSDEIVPAHRRRIGRSLAAGTLLSLSALAGLLAAAVGLLPVDLSGVPLPLFTAAPLTPLLLPGLVTRREEQRIGERDTQFATFIRALGSVEGVKQSSTSGVLAQLKSKDFGCLTADVIRLYRRLHVRLDATKAWRLFAAETGSYLVQKFGEMYVTGRRMGGDPAELGRLISANLGEVLKLREQRRQEVTTIVGVVYGLTAASVFAFFIGLEVVNLLIRVVESMDLSSTLTDSFLHVEGYDIELIEYLLLCAVLVNALLSALLIRTIDRGHFVSGYVHFVLLTWLSAIVAVVTKHAVGALMGG